MSDQVVPWDVCKLAFVLEGAHSLEEEAIWGADDEGSLSLPEGWSLSETDLSGLCGLAVVFEVDGMPTEEDGKQLLEQLKSIAKEAHDHG